MTDTDDATLETQLTDEEAQRDIAEAVSARHSIARKYVIRLRRRHPDATPAEVIQMLERHYATSITTAGTAIAVGGFAATVGISLIPGGGAATATAKAASKEVAKKAAKEVAKVTLKEASKAAAKGVALNAAKGGAQRVAGLLPAGEQQLQFEITAIFGLALAEIHGIDYDRDQAHALVYGLTNERVSQQQIAKMAADVANVSREAVAGAGDAAGLPWASTLADALPGGAAQNLVRTMQTGHLDTVRDSMTGKQQAAVDYGVAAAARGVERFVFGREVIASARAAFPEAPADFPTRLAVPIGDDAEPEPNRALVALEDAAKASGTWVAGAAVSVGSGVANGAAAVGTGVSTAAGSATRVFRRVDLDGDGVADEAMAITAIKGAGGAVSGAAGAVGGRVTGLFKRGKQNDEAAATADEGLLAN